ncbi:MAG TPA: hypothetical protein VLE23_06325 [Geminicoccaceae bacterium]|nr:hypothetical protein [Geminicoccaceae bacterium]
MRAAMIPPFPMQLTLFGSALYGEFCLGLCRALAAPWLDPGWLVRAGQQPLALSPSPPAAAIRQDGAKGFPAAARSSESAGGRVIQVPPARWRGRRDPSVSSAAER